MALTLKDNFKLTVNKPNFDRDIYQTKADMKAVRSTRMPEMFIASCVEDGKVYLYNKKNEDDPDTGKWRILTGATSVVTPGGQTITVDTSVTETSENPVSSKAVWTAIQAVKNAGGESVSVEANIEVPEDTQTEVLKTVKIGDKYYNASVMSQAEKTLLEAKITAEEGTRLAKDTELEGKIALKADVTALDAKADKTELETVKTTLDGKADKASLESYSAKTELDAVKAALETKADKTLLADYSTKTELNTVKTAFNNLVSYKNADDSNLAAEVTTRAAKDAEGAEKAKGSEAVLQAYNNADTEHYSKITAGMNPDTKKPFASLLASENGQYAGIEADSANVTVFGNLQNSAKKAYATKEDVAGSVGSLETKIQAKASLSDIEGTYAKKTDIANFATREELETGISTVEAGSASLKTEIGKIWIKTLYGGNQTGIYVDDAVVLSDGNIVASGHQNSSSNPRYLVSKDSGASWTFGTVASVGSLGRLLVIDDSTIIAGGKNNTGIKYSDARNIYWVKTNITTGEWSLAVNSGDSKKIVAVYCGGGVESGYLGIRYSVDGGKTWQASSNTNGNFAAVTYSKGVFAAFGTGFTQGVWYSVDNGATWTQSARNSDSAIDYTVFVSKSGVIFYSSETSGSPSTRTGVWKSTDGGKSWKQTKLTNKKVYNITELSDGTLVGSDYYSTDGGDSWTASTYDEVYTDMQGSIIRISDDNLLLSKLGSGAVWQSTDKGRSWKKISKATAYYLYSGKDFVLAFDGDGVLKSSGAQTFAKIGNDGSFDIGFGAAALTTFSGMKMVVLSGTYTGSDLDGFAEKLGVTKTNGGDLYIIGTVLNDSTVLVNPKLSYASNAYGAVSFKLNYTLGSSSSGTSIGSVFKANGLLCKSAASL